MRARADDARNAGLAIFGTRLSRVQDPRLAAVISMLQLVRTGAPVTAAEKTQIMELMEEPLGIANLDTIFVDMLRKVANAYGEAGELQIEAINRLKPCLAMADSSFERPIERPLD